MEIFGVRFTTFRERSYKQARQEQKGRLEQVGVGAINQKPPTAVFLDTDTDVNTHMWANRG